MEFVKNVQQNALLAQVGLSVYHVIQAIILMVHLALLAAQQILMLKITNAMFVLQLAQLVFLRQLALLVIPTYS